jgi:CubicO group peptidase (beta-lactamase class C family)
MQLVDEGVIDLDEPMAASFPYPRIPDKQAYGRITPRMVLSHRTGLPNWVGDTDDLDRTDPIAFDAPPGTVYSYSGEAFELLRAYVEKVTGKSLDELFKERLGESMRRSTFALPLPEGVEPSRGYRSARDPDSGRGMTTLRERGGAAGGLVTTAGDYARFVGLICRGEGLSPATHRAMLEPQSPVPADGRAPGLTSWALGWGVMSLGPETIVYHDGNNGEYRSLVGFLPESGEGYVFLANGSNGGDLILALIEQLQ